MIGETRLYNIFPIPVWTLALEPSKVDEMNRYLMAEVEKIRDTLPEVQLGDAWQTPTDLQTRAEFEPICKFILLSAEKVLGLLAVDYESIAITGFWGNIRPPGSSHPGHTHPNNYLSGTYYVQTPKGGDSIVFRDSRPETNIIAPPLKQQNEHNLRSLSLPVEAGSLVIFPSWVPHLVPPNAGDIDRISLSFNIMFESYVEQMSKPKWKGGQLSS